MAQPPNTPEDADDRTVAAGPSLPQPAAGPRIIASVADLELSVLELNLLDANQQTELINLRENIKDARILAKEMLQRDWLTPFQVNQLFQGKGHELTLGPYLLLERIGEGGMGAVYKARHQLMRRFVALKLIRKDRLNNADIVQRFYREIRAAATLHHPNIVIAHDAAHIGDVHFLVMEYVEGADLGKLVKKEGPLPVGLACDYVRQAALGLQHAHDMGMVHRDIKPGNLLLNSKKVKAGATVKILDLGLARLSMGGGEATLGELTQEGAVMGTPDYIAPEQAQESHTVDLRADIYSLGCTLYYLLTGNVPYPSGTLMQKLMKHQSEPLPNAQKLRPEVPDGLLDVLKKMTAKRVEDRYATAGDVVTALSLFTTTVIPAAVPLTGVTSNPPAAIAVTATPPVARVLSDESVQRITTSAPVAVPLAGIAVEPGSETIPPGTGDSSPSWTGYILKRLRLPPPGKDRKRWYIAGGGGAALLLLLLIWAFSGSKPKPDTRTALEKLDGDAIPASNRPPRPVKHLVGVLGEHRVHHATSYPRLIAVGPKGTVVASYGADGNVRFSDPSTLQQKAVWNTGTACSALCFSPDGETLAVGCGNQVRLWDVKASRELGPLDGHQGPVTGLAFTPDGERLLSSSQDKTVGVWDMRRGQLLGRFDKHKTTVHCVAVSPDGKRAVSGAGNGKVGSDQALRVWSVETREPLAEFAGTDSYTTAVAWSPTDDLILSVEYTGALHAWDTKTGKDVLPPASLASGHYPHLSVSPDDRYLATWSNSPSETVRLWEIESGRNIRSYGPRSTGPGVFLPDGGEKIVLAVDTSLQVWDIRKNVDLVPFVGHTRPPTFLQLRDDGRVLISGGKDGLRRWDLEKGTSTPLGPVSESLYSVSPSARFALTLEASGAGTHNIDLWDLASGRKVRQKSFAEPMPVRILSFFKDDDHAFFGGRSGKFQLWNVEKDRDLDTHEVKPPEHMADLLSSRDHTRLLLRMASGRVVLWDVEGRGAVREWPLPASAAVFSPDETQWYYGAADGVVGVVPVLGEKAPPPYFHLHKTAVSHLAVTPDGKRLLSADVSGRVVLWDTTREGDNKIHEWEHPAGPVQAVLCASDNRHVFIANANNTIYILRLPAP